MRKPVKKKIILEPDVKYDSILVAKLINKIMQDGKKSIAEKVVYSAFEQAEKQLKKPALEILEKAIENAGPEMEVRSRRVGGANYQVPYEVRADRKITLALRWLVEIARSRGGKPMQVKLAEELVSAANNEGEVVKKKENMHRMAKANRAFAHFAW